MNNVTDNSAGQNRPIPNRKKRKPVKLTYILAGILVVAVIFTLVSILIFTKNVSIETNLNLPGAFKNGLKTPHPQKNIIEEDLLKMAANSNSEPLVLSAYIETTDFESWETKPLPRRMTNKTNLKKVTFSQLKSCSKLPSQWPVDNYPDDDPFLPWIHDVFPSNDGKMIRFVAQNKRRCNTGKKMGEIKKHMQPQIALFQTVPIKRIEVDGEEGQTRYRLSSYEDADTDGMETRFICRFKPSLEETLSTFPVNYDYHTFRKGYSATFTEEGFDNHMIWTSQLMFDCPVPPSMQKIVREGTSVVNDYATMFVDLIPIRTPPRYGKPVIFLPPRFGKQNSFDAGIEWGTDHILPLIENSGRWENIPICKTTLQTYDLDHLNERNDEKDLNQKTSLFATAPKKDLENSYLPNKKVHNLVGCTWASTSFTTRGDRAQINDGQRRLYEWLSFHLLAGFDHMYIYDNSGAFSETESLKEVIDLFPGRVTRIDWPSKVCNNNPNNRDNKGERSSQYAAETSCRLRFGAHSEWLGSMDTDEYLVPVGENNNLTGILDDLDKNNIKIYTFNSQRARPRFDLLAPPKTNKNRGGRLSFEPEVATNSTFFHTYNCHREKPRTDFVPAEKQIYKPDYVLLHHIHYSTITQRSQLSYSETQDINIKWRQRYNELLGRIADESKEALMLHSKSVVESQTVNFEQFCKSAMYSDECKLGFPWPNGEVSSTEVSNGKGFLYNCFIDDKIESYWVPRLIEAMKRTNNTLRF